MKKTLLNFLPLIRSLRLKESKSFILRGIKSRRLGLGFPTCLTCPSDHSIQSEPYLYWNWYIRINPCNADIHPHPPHPVIFTGNIMMLMYGILQYFVITGIPQLGSASAIWVRIRPYSHRIFTIGIWNFNDDLWTNIRSACIRCNPRPI